MKLDNINIKYMKIKLTSTSKGASNYLWHDSPCCMNYVSNNPSMDGVPRFEIGSIYHKDQVDKAKKVFNQFQKPDLLLIDFRRQIIEASHPKYNTASKKNKELTEKQKSKTRSMSMSATSHLYQVPTKTEYKYDINGYRAHQFGNYDVKQIESKVKSAKKFFSFGRRLDLSRPLNFFPGPGTYNIQRQKPKTERVVPFSRTCGQFHKINLQNIENPQTDRLNYNKSKI